MTTRPEHHPMQFLGIGRMTGLEICNLPEVAKSELVVVEDGDTVDELKLLELVACDGRVDEDVTPTVVVGGLGALVDTPPFENDEDVDCAGGALEELVYAFALDVPELEPAATEELPD